MAQYQKEIDERLEIEKEFLGDSYKQSDDEELYSDEYPVEFFYLWDILAESLEVYRIIRQWMRDNELSSVTSLLIAVAAKRCIDIEKLLVDLPLIHHGFCTTMFPAQEQNQNQKSSSLED